MTDNSERSQIPPTSKTVAEQQEEYRARIADGMWPDANVEDRLRLLAEIERLTRELAVQKGVNNLAYIPHRALVESRDGLQKRYDKVEAERDRLRAALEWYARAGWMEFSNEDDNGRRAREVLSGASPAPETAEKPAPFRALKAQIQADHAYAWAWHCNLAMTFFDAGCDIDMANEGAARIMQMMFDVDVKAFPEWAQRRRQDPNVAKDRYSRLCEILDASAESGELPSGLHEAFQMGSAVLNEWLDRTAEKSAENK